MDKSISILIASRYDNDQKRILELLSKQTEFVITDVVKDETGAIIKSEYFKPNILLLDLQLSELNGYELVRIIHRRSPATAIIILQDSNFFQSVKNFFPLINRVSGLLIKELDFDKLVHIIKIVFLGGSYLNASISTNIIKSFAANDQSLEDIEFDFLSSAERGIIIFIAQGLSDSKIACELNLSIGAIRNSIAVIKKKTNLKSRIEIVIYSLAMGFIRMEQLSKWKKYNNNDIIKYKSIKKRGLSDDAEID